jgi:hypothetical protein
MIEVLSPAGVPQADEGSLASRLRSLAGRTVALLSNNKNGTDSIYRGLEAALREQGVNDIVRFSKPVASMAHGDLAGVAASCDAAVVALGD